MTMNASNIDDLKIKLSELLLNYVRLVVKQQLIITDEFTIGYGPDFREKSNFVKPISEEFGVIVYSVDKIFDSNPLTIILVLVGKLGEVFKQFELAPFLKVTLEDNGDGYYDFVSVDDVVAFRHCAPLFINSKTESSFLDFVIAIEKQLLLTSIKYG